ncbi:MAG: PorT family protein [Candidatus Symbiothrix sp.]|jgi:hypothetical protein|nr:PorT family protein [Candidatus Symbiothrix sp.]
MKKVVLVMLIALSAVTMNAQGIKFGVTAGLNFSNWSGDVKDAKMKTGFQAGVVADFALTESFSIAPELLFAQRGTKFEAGDESSTYTLNYLQLPINALYKFSIADDSKLFIFAGPYVGYGLSGTVKEKFDGESDSGDIKFGSGDGKLNPLDFGINAGVGYQYTKFFIKAQYGLGFGNLSNSSKESIKNGSIGISVGYLF